MNKKLSQQPDLRVCIAAFAGAHGVQGHAKIKTFTTDPHAVADYGPLETEDCKRVFSIKLIRSLKPELVLVSAPEITSREDAASLAGTRLYVARDKLSEPEEEEFYYSDLIGLTVKTQNGESVGKIAAVQNYGAGDILELREIPGHKGSHMVPFTKEAVPDIRVSEKLVILDKDYLPSEVPESEVGKG